MKAEEEKVVVVKVLVRKQSPSPPRSNQEKLPQKLPDFDEPYERTRHHGSVLLGGVNFLPTRQSLHCPFCQRSNLLENEVLEEPVGGVVPKVGEGVWWGLC